jgi:type IV secretory pathway VirB4 component
MITVSPIGKFELSDTTRTPMTGSALGCLFPFSTTNMIEEDGILYGYHGLNGSPITIDRWNRRNGYNQSVIGNIGAGKSYGTKLLLRRLVRDRDVSAVIVDPRGGFRSLVNAFGIESETVTVGGNVGINPLQISPTPDDVLQARPDMDPLGERIESVMGFFERLYAEGDNSGLDAMRRGVLSEAVTQAYTDAGITRDPQMHSRKSPLPGDVDSVLARYARDPTEALGEDASEREIEKWADTAAELRMAMQPFREGGRYQHLNQPTSVGLGRNSNKRVILLDIQQSEGSGDMPLTMKLLFNAIYERAKGPGRMIAAFDEAHHIMDNPGGWTGLSDRSGTRGTSTSH